MPVPQQTAAPLQRLTGARSAKAKLVNSRGNRNDNMAMLCPFFNSWKETKKGKKGGAKFSRRKNNPNIYRANSTITKTHSQFSIHIEIQLTPGSIQTSRSLWSPSQPQRLSSIERLSICVNASVTVSTNLPPQDSFKWSCCVFTKYIHIILLSRGIVCFLRLNPHRYLILIVGTGIQDKHELHGCTLLPSL